LMFCPKCGSILMPMMDGEKKVIGCKCGFRSKSKDKIELKDKLEEITKVETVDKEINVDPLVEAECPKCGHDKAYFWEVQTRASDEPATKFMKCEKCNHIWRDYK
jgi:transcription factor S